jgi:hypothetical protein
MVFQPSFDAERKRARLCGSSEITREAHERLWRQLIGRFGEDDDVRPAVGGGVDTQQGSEVILVLGVVPGLREVRPKPVEH